VPVVPIDQRGSGSDPAIREFHIADNGITIGEPINLQSLLI
jgi:hypothetical protein